MIHAALALWSAQRDYQTLPSEQTNHSDSASAIRAVILDYGDVISQSPDPAAMAAMAATFDLPEDRFRQLYGALRHDYDRGELSAHQYWTKIASAAGVELNASQLEELRRTDVAMWSRLNSSVLRWVGQLRSTGFKTAVLSNMHDDMVQKVRKDPMWAEMFDCLTLSSAIHIAKPDAGIFRHCLECLRVAPCEALFVDDREVNVKAAQALGIRGIVAASPTQLRVQLDAIGFSPLPE
ncbi:MAG TPA: HAD family phosphatase [Terriglobales bacterium]